MKNTKLLILTTFLLYILISCVKQEAPESAPTVITLDPSDVKLNSFVLTGDVTSEGFNATKERGFVWSAKNSNPSVSDAKLSVGYGKGQYSILLDKLNPNSTYYYKAFATNDKGTSYGETKIVKTADYSLATLTTDLPKNISYTSAELGGNVSDEGGIAVSERGICLAINKTPTIDDIKINNGKGLGSFANIVIRLIEGTNYNVRAYAINGKGTNYGNEQKFSTLALKTPSVTTEMPSNIAATYVTLQGKVTDNGGTDLVEKGFCISKNPSPGINDIRVKASNNDAGAYAIVLTALDPQTKYYVRAYAQNSKGLSFGNEISFNTSQATIPIVGTNDFQEITENSVRAGVEINNNGGADILEFGVCISTNRNPTIFDRKIVLGTGNSPGRMDNFGGLTSGTTYYLRGYAINRVGVGYGPERSFTTINPIINTLKSGLIAYYPFNGSADDASGNGNNGNLVGGVSNTTDRFGRTNSAFYFDGVSGRIDVPGLNSIQYKPITYSAWVVVKSYFPTNISGFQFKAIIGRNTAFIEPNGVIGFSYISYSKNTFNTFFMWRGGGILTGSEPNALISPQIGTWTHIVFTQNSSGDWKWYQNGILTNSGNFIDSQNQFNYFQIGSCNNQTSGNTFWNDKLDDIGVWNRVLSTDEINYLYQNNFQP